MITAEETKTKPQGRDDVSAFLEKKMARCCWAVLDEQP
jgi:hypothetical protein